VRIDRAPRSKKRIACELLIKGDRYKGIVLDVSAFGIFVQTNARPRPGAQIGVKLTLPGSNGPLSIGATVVRRNVVPPQLLAVARGGVGLALADPPKAYHDFVSEMSPEQSDFVLTKRGKGVAGATRGRPGSAAGGGQVGPAGKGGGAPPPKRFRIHAVDCNSGEKNTFLIVTTSEEDAKAKALEELGEAWQVLFIERV